MSRRPATLVCLCISLSLAVSVWPHSARATDESVLTPVIVELFTSQGCSSCPPADEVLRALERNQPVAGALVIPLSEHVDYWNRLGWRDPFSSKQFSERQEVYVRALGVQSLYTPMMVVDGHVAFVGSQSVAAHQAVVSAVQRPKATVLVDVSRERDRPTVRVTTATRRVPHTDEPIDVWVAVTERRLSTEVTHGENAFRTLRHTGVVRTLELVGTLPGPERGTAEVQGHLRLHPTWNHSHLRVVAFLQERSSRRILGAAQVPMP